MDEDKRAELASILFHAKRMVEDGSIDEKWYHKAVIGAAFEFLGDKDYTRVIEHLHMVPWGYYVMDMPTQMEHDTTFAEQVMALADYLVASGMVHVGADDVTSTATLQA